MEDNYDYEYYDRDIFYYFPIEEVDQLEDIQQGEPPVPIFRRVRDRPSPYDTTDLIFWQRYRFSKDSVVRLTSLLFPEPIFNNRGCPLPRENVVCSSLHLLGGASFQRVEGVCALVSKSTVQKYLYLFLERLAQHKQTFLHMPTRAMMEENARAIQQKYKLYNIVGNMNICMYVCNCLCTNHSVVFCWSHSSRVKLCTFTYFLLTNCLRNVNAYIYTKLYHFDTSIKFFFI